MPIWSRWNWARTIFGGLGYGSNLQEPPTCVYSFQGPMGLPTSPWGRLRCTGALVDEYFVALSGFRHGVSGFYSGEAEEEPEVGE